MSELSTKFNNSKLDKLYLGKSEYLIPMHAHINLFFTHLEYSPDQLPFQGVDYSLLSAKSAVKTLEEFHAKFAAVMYKIVSRTVKPITSFDYLYGTLEEKDVDKRFSELIRRNYMLSQIVQYFELEDLGLFKLGDTMMYSKLVNLVLYMLAAIDFDFDILFTVTCNILGFEGLSPTGCIVKFDSQHYFALKEATAKHESSFHGKVLGMKHDEKFKLEQIKPSFKICDLQEYYQQFVGPIYEEIRVGINQALVALQTGREKKQSICLWLNKWKIEENNDLQVSRCNNNLSYFKLQCYD